MKTFRTFMVLIAVMAIALLYYVALTDQQFSDKFLKEQKKQIAIEQMQKEWAEYKDLFSISFRGLDSMDVTYKGTVVQSYKTMYEYGLYGRQRGDTIVVAYDSTKVWRAIK